MNKMIKWFVGISITLVLLFLLVTTYNYGLVFSNTYISIILLGVMLFFPLAYAFGLFR